jgi:DNA-binding CsgD family transcriptional regulator
VPDFISAATQFSKDVREMRTPRDVLLAVDAISQRRKLTMFCCWYVPRRSNDFAAWTINETLFYGEKHVPFATAAGQAEYLRLYQSQTMQYGVSALGNYGREEGYAFTLHEAMRALRLTGKQDWVFALLRRYGARDGLFCTSRNWQMLFSSPRVLSPEIGPISRFILYAVAGAAVGRIGDLMKRRGDKSKPMLSQRELQILRLLSFDKTQQVVANQLGITSQTINDHLKRIFRKLNVHSTTGAACEAFRRGLLQ